MDRMLLGRRAMGKTERFAVLAALMSMAGCFGGDDGSYGGPYGPQPPTYPDYPEDPAGFQPDNQPFPDAPPPPKGPQPDFGTTVTLADAPPPITGGTLLVTKDGTTAFAADPDRDEVYVVDLATKKVTTVALVAHDEPGRLVEDAAGRVHVALRRGGAVVTLDTTGALLGRRAACPAPRGIAWDAGGARLLLACEGGEVVAVDPAADGAVTLLSRIDRDLRDVVVAGSKIYVSRYRNAEILELDASGSVLARTRPRASSSSLGAAALEATLAWRMTASPQAGDPPIVVHELATTGQVATQPGGYGESPTFDAETCAFPGFGTIVTSALWDGITDANLSVAAVLPVDIAVDATREVIVAAGNGHTASLPQVFQLGRGASCEDHETVTYSPAGQATAVALLSAGRVLVQSRQPAMLVELPSGTTIALSAKDREDTGHAIFHSNSGSGLACASCHGEGGDDGHVWSFDSLGERRTPSLRGTIEGTAPYHWGGEMADVAHLVDDVLSGRMNGPTLSTAQKTSVASWLYGLPAPIPPSGVDAAAAARGQALFASDATQCATCHSGPKLTNSATVDVGTGGAFQVPSLVGVSARAPLMHAGCAATLEDRFGICATQKHGKTDSLAPSDVADLVAYLKTL